MSRCSIPWLFKTSIAEILRGSVGGCRGRGMAHWPCGAGAGRKIEVLDPMAICLCNVYWEYLLDS